MAEDGLLLAAAALARLLRSEKERKVRSGELCVSRLAEVASGYLSSHLGGLAARV